MRQRRTVTVAAAVIAASLLCMCPSLPSAATGQPAAPAVVGFLALASPQAYADRVAGILRGLEEKGYINGQNLTVEYRWAHGNVDELPALANDLVGRRVDVIITSGSSLAALAAKAATSTIPIVFGTGGDPVKDGLVSSLNRPGGNITGTSVLTENLAAKRLELLGEMFPRVEVFGLLVNPVSAPSIEQQRDTEEAARSLRLRIRVLTAKGEGELDSALSAIAHQGVPLLVVADPMFYAFREQIVAAARRHGVPAIYPRRDFVSAGGLASYGPDLSDVYRQQGIYAGEILNGARPGDLPILQPNKFQLVINRRSAQALGITIPQSLLLRATETID